MSRAPPAANGQRIHRTTVRSIASFDTRPATVADQLPWFDRTVSTGPYRILVARRAGRVLGYASSGLYREHEAFARTVEVGIGLHADSRGQGIGSQLYRVLFDYLTSQPVHVAVAGIAIPNDASVALHRRFGFREVGVFHEYAIKNGQHLSSLWLEKLQAVPIADGSLPTTKSRSADSSAASKAAWAFAFSSCARRAAAIG